MAGASAVIRALKQHFARFGIPSAVVSDNSPQFILQEFKNFARNWYFIHDPRSPYHPNANGKAESAVKAAKVN